MELQELYNRIGLPAELVQRLERAGREIDWAQAAPCLEGLLEIQNAPAAFQRLNELLAGDQDHFKLLCCYLECARRAYESYRQAGIPDGIYLDTMACFSRFLREDREIYGRFCFPRGWWAYRQISMALFRLGALEYELSTWKGARAIHLHIPSDADLSPLSMDRSLEQAADFFQTYFPEYCHVPCLCDSWLLSPRLGPLLSPASRILAFQKRFQVLQENLKDREYLQWLFQVPADTEYARLPERTSLQREVKALLLQGGAVGCAFGVLERKPVP